ncbi:MAG: hypothetical protein ACOVMM_13205 [Chitinophagaceae bacterium]
MKFIPVLVFLLAISCTSKVELNIELSTIQKVDSASSITITKTNQSSFSKNVSGENFASFELENLNNNKVEIKTEDKKSNDDCVNYSETNTSVLNKKTTISQRPLYISKIDSNTCKFSIACYPKYFVIKNIGQNDTFRLIAKSIDQNEAIVSKLFVLKK